MTTFNYDTTVPATSHPPKNDQPTMQTNTASISGLIGVDHIGFNTPNGGAHAQVQLLNVTGGNGTIPVGLLGNGYETLYSSATAGTGELWFVRGAAGTGIQLTGPGTPSSSTNGYTFLPGGMLIQWGSISDTSSNPTVTFLSVGNINFPKNIFNVQVTRLHSSSSPGNTFGYWVRTSSISTTGFQIINNDGHTWAYYWIAIGN